MNRFILSLLAVVLVIALMFKSIYAQEEALVIEDMVFEKPRRAPVIFQHDIHNEKANIEDCNGCHHLYEDGQLLEDESSEDQSCSDCHKLKKTFNNNLPLMKAYHLRCKGCHQEKEAGPIMCGECHKKELR